MPGDGFLQRLNIFLYSYSEISAISCSISLGLSKKSSYQFDTSRNIGVLKLGSLVWWNILLKCCANASAFSMFVSSVFPFTEISVCSQVGYILRKFFNTLPIFFVIS